ncbi:unnamed protein product [Staurois parvus]|uniref:Endonuclease/exonuclease/phosphatase domain-containing protein n=1 Tax=Staurois parvus TaxID=386267 RepID=A0ABN9EFX5_9NEOB|nr:unnamed protein product [Staurois parvus]
MPSLNSLSGHLSLNVLSINVKGLNTPGKRSLLLSHLFKQRADIVFLQETHFRHDAILKLTKFGFRQFIMLLTLMLNLKAFPF